MSYARRGYLICDRNCVYGHACVKRARANYPNIR